MNGQNIRCLRWVGGADGRQKASDYDPSRGLPGQAHDSRAFEMHSHHFGFVAVPRGWRERLPIKPQPFDEFSAALWIIENTAFADHVRWFNGKQVPLKRGQIVTSHGAMETAFGWSGKKVRGFEQRMTKNGFWSLERTHSYTVATVLIYEDFVWLKEEEGRSNGRPRGRGKAQAGHPRKQLQHRQHGATIPSEPNGSSGEGSPAPEDDSFFDRSVGWAEKEMQWNSAAARQEISCFLDYHRARGSMLKDWDAAMRKWCRSPLAKKKGFDLTGEAAARNDALKRGAWRYGPLTL
jgi:hypothetical protein